MPTIEQINEEFLRGAEDLRYSMMVRGTERWFNDKPKYATPHNSSYYRSIKYKGNNTYVFVADVDGPSFNRTSISANAKLYLSAQRLFSVSPLLKASGMKGAQLIMDVDFPDHWTEKTCLHGLARIAFTLWKDSCIKQLFGVKFGLKLPGTYVDACMYKKGRVVRSFCKHLGSGRYSVPYKWTDNIRQVEDRMLLKTEPLWPEIPELWYSDIEGRLEEYTDKYFFETQGPGETVLKRLDETRVKRQHAGNPGRIYTQLTPRLKKIADMDADIHHDLKWPLLLFMYLDLAMTRGEIFDWVWKNCAWHDLNDISKTRYHINYSCDWADETGGRAPRWVYE